MGEKRMVPTLSRHSGKASQLPTTRVVIVSELDQLFMEFLLKNKFTRIARTNVRKTEMGLAFRLSGLIHVMAMEALGVGVRKDTQSGNSGCDRGGLRGPCPEGDSQDAHNILCGGHSPPPTPADGEMEAEG